MTFHAVVPRPAPSWPACNLPPATVRVYEPDGTRRERRYWIRASPATPTAATGPRPTGRTRWRYRSPRGVAGWSPTSRSASCSPVGWTPSLIVALLAEQGQTGLSTFSIGFESVGGREGDEFQYSDVIAERFATEHHRIHIPTATCSPLEAAVQAMSEPMVSHDAVAFTCCRRPLRST